MNEPIDIEAWEAQAKLDLQILHNHIFALIREVRDWKNVAKAEHDELEKLREQFQYAVKSWKLEEEINYETIKDLKEEIKRLYEAFQDAYDIFDYQMGIGGCSDLDEKYSGRVWMKKYFPEWKNGRTRYNEDCALSSEALCDKPHKNEIYGKADRQGTITCKHGTPSNEKCILCES